MKVRKTVSLFLSAFLLASNLNSFNLNAFAEGESDFDLVYVSTVVNGKSQNLPAIKNKDGEVFLSGKILSDITVYQNNTSPTLFQHDKANDNKKYREILIDKNSKNAQIVSFWSGEPIIKKTISLPDIIENEGELYFPVAEMLPVLNANATILNNKLYIEDCPYSMTNIMPELSISDYLFSFDENASVLAGYSYLFKGLLGEFERFEPIIGARIAHVDAYKEIFTNYLAEDETYFDAFTDEEEYLRPIVDFVANDDMNREETVVEAFDALNTITQKEHDELVEIYSTLDSYDMFYTTMDDISKASKSLDFGIKTSAYIELYYNHISDHYDMLNSVYNVKGKNIATSIAGEGVGKYLATPVSNTEQIIAAADIYSLYDENNKTSIIKYCTEQIAQLYTDEFTSNLDSYPPQLTYAKIASVCSKLFFIAIDSKVYNVANNCEYLKFYNKIMEQSLSKYGEYKNSYDNISWNCIENSRLSAILTLLSSRSMYQAILDSEEVYGNSGKYYQTKIDSINEVLKKLYLAKNYCYTDSEEYIDERITFLNTSIEDIDINNTPALNNNNNYNDAEHELLQIYARYYYSHFDDKSSSVFITDLTHDGIIELTVITRKTNTFNGEEYLDHADLLVYQISENTLYQIYEEFTDSAHVGNKGFSLTSINGLDYLIEYAPWVYGGNATYTGLVYSLDSNNKEIIEYYNANITPFVNDESRFDYDSNLKEQGTNEFNTFLGEYIPNSITLCNNSGIDLSKIDNSVFDRFTVSNAENVFKEVSTDYIDFSTINLNEVGEVHSIDGLVLRKEPNRESSQIAVIPNHTILKVVGVDKNFQQHNDNYNWIIVEYEGKIGYVASDYITINFNKPIAELSENDIIIMGILLNQQYASLLNRFRFDWGLLDCTPATDSDPSLAPFVRLEPKHSISELKEQYNQYFSSKYNLTDIEINHKEIDGYLYCGTGRGSSVWLDYSEIYDIKSISEIDNEITFYKCTYGTMDVWTGNEAMYLQEFSIIYEDGVWKCGKQTLEAK